MSRNSSFLEDNVEEIQKRRWGFVLWLGLLLAALGVVGLKVYLNNRAADEQALIAQLQAIRGSVSLYVALNGDFPPDLPTLTTQRYTVGQRSAFYLIGIEVDGESHPIDPFGKPYFYDRATGSVQTISKDYRGW
jgi:hypothetical protein